MRDAHIIMLLRMLEYYGGILLLTTNRVKDFDPAMQKSNLPRPPIPRSKQGHQEDNIGEFLRIERPFHCRWGGR